MGKRMNDKNQQDFISQFMNDTEKVREAIQLGINEALLKHKQAGNPVCGLKDGKVYWLKPEDIVVNGK